MNPYKYESLITPPPIKPREFMSTISHLIKESTADFSVIQCFACRDLTPILHLSFKKMKIRGAGCFFLVSDVCFGLSKVYICPAGLGYGSAVFEPP